MKSLTKRNYAIVIVILGITGFLIWRFIRPMNIFVVSEAFERPIDTSGAPSMLKTLRADECATCHREFYDEWQTTIHSQAWTDPYFQVDWVFDGSQQICKNCHIPLDRQQKYKVLGFKDKEKLEPILEDNPDFDAKLQHEGVTCAVCHLREGKVVGVLGIENAPHPIKTLNDPNEMCMKCHVVGGDRWDTFFRFPPCGTVAEIQTQSGARLGSEDSKGSKGSPSTRAEPTKPGGPSVGPKDAPSMSGRSGEIRVPNTAALSCVECHMPLVERSIVAGGKVWPTRRHLWRGGHDPAMVKKGLEVRFEETRSDSSNKRAFVLTLTNVGAAHYLPTGTPDRHLTVQLRLLDVQANVLRAEHHTLKRTLMWRPFIVDLWDTRLPRWQPRTYIFEFSAAGKTKPAQVEAIVRYHLLDEKRRKRIGYKNKEPIAYEVFRKSISL